jgi:voltage-gated potassium channel
LPFQIESRLSNWQSRSAKPLIALSLLYVAIFVYPIFAYPHAEHLHDLLKALDYAIQAVFGIDFLIQIYLSKDAWNFLKREWFVLVVVAVPFLRPLRAFRGLVYFRQAGGNPSNAPHIRFPLFIASISTLMGVTLAAAVLEVERNAPGSNIHTTSDALWWSLVTLTTIGYGDRYPVTNEGRLLAGCLLIFGIGMIASLTGFMASWIHGQFQKNSD